MTDQGSRDPPTPAAARLAAIPVRPAGDSPCAASEPFVLRVLGESMAPEFVEGDIVVIEPDGLARDGSFVLAQCDGEWSLRQLRRASEGWELAALQAGIAAVPIADLGPVRGVVIQRSKPGRRRALKRYVD